MPSNPRPATRDALQSLPAGAAIEPEKDSSCHDKSAPPEPVPPRAGRTGGLGARAERPSEGSKRKGREKDKGTGRGAKAPSARAEPRE
jgi:hypothetical protein